MGLSTCYGIVQQHGGRIWAESTPGEGACFFIELPVVPPVLASDSARALPPNSTRRATQKRILIIEDEAEVADLVARILTGDGGAADLAFDGRTALAKLEHQSYDLVICDLTIPGLSGLQLYERLKLKRPDQAARIIFLTGNRWNGNIQRFLRESGAAWLEKPFNLPALRELAGRLMENGLPHGCQSCPNEPIAA